MLGSCRHLKLFRVCVKLNKKRVFYLTLVLTKKQSEANKSAILHYSWYPHDFFFGISLGGRELLEHNNLPHNFGFINIVTRKNSMIIEPW